MKHLIFLLLFIVNFLLFLAFLLLGTYPISLIIVYFIFLIVFLTMVLYPFSSKKMFHYKTELLICSILFVISLGIRLYQVDKVTPGIYGDEITVAVAAEQLINSHIITPFVSTNFGHATPLLYLTGIIIHTFGRSILTIRLVSIIFGALDIVAFYILLRAFFKKPLAIIVSLCMSFAYAHVIVSRLAYEMTPSIFLGILSAIFLYYAWRKHSAKYYALLGITLGMGVYTYLSFRLIALLYIAIALVTFFLIKNFRQRIASLLLFLLSLFILLLPLLSYTIHHPNDVLARTQAVSIFNRHLSTSGTLAEIGVSTEKSLGMFFFSKDPNLRNNPTNQTMFDPLTGVLMLFGLLILFKKSKPLFWVILFLSIPIFLNDILSSDFFPEFHRLGQGHPNTLRLSNIIPLVYLLFAFGLNFLAEHAKRMNKYAGEILLCVILVVVIIINWQWYFNQGYNHFIYYTNGVFVLQETDFINNTGYKDFYISPSFKNDSRMQYFLKPGITLHDFTYTSISNPLSSIPTNVPVIIDAANDTPFSTNLVKQLETRPRGIISKSHRTPHGEVWDFIILKMTQK